MTRSNGGETRRVRAIYARTARHYDQMIGPVERLLVGEGRVWAAGQAHGEVLEIAAGTGRNFAHYPRDTRVTALDLSSDMLARARPRIDRAPCPVQLLVGDAQALDLPDEGFDTVLATLALCSIPDPDAALAEMARVLRPGGRLLLVEHVASLIAVVRTVQRLLEPVAVRCAADHLLRRPERDVAAAGLAIDYLHRSKAGIMMRLTATKLR
ncbi:MAG: class I SAM-dependent methyltransferase [Pseudonocardia sp.]